ncbi:MAG: hypothetical protein DHS20C18_42430 [Saprospiraceae bacterium]|nr:MAG: hypothetical protein DHS20C18_42430 [Saprospiraceae bacterium]
MKSLLFSVAFGLFGALMLGGCGKFGKVPDAVHAAFEAKYPGENKPDWQVDRNGNFEAHFKEDGEKFRADFSPSGAWIETERSIKRKELPDAVKEAIEKQYKDIKIVEVEWVDHAQRGIFYDVEFKEGGRKYDVEFSTQGTIVGGEGD